METPSHKQQARAKAIGAEIESWRGRRNLTREQLGEKVGKSANSIGRYERGDTTPDATETWAIAVALGISFTHLVSRAEEAVHIDAYEPDEDTLRELRLAPDISDDEEAAQVQSYLEDQEAARHGDLDGPDQL